MGEKETDIGRAVVGFKEIHRRLIELATDFNRVVDENYEHFLLHLKRETILTGSSFISEPSANY